MPEGDLNIYPIEILRGVSRKSQLLKRSIPAGSKREKRLTIIPRIRGRPVGG